VVSKAFSKEAKNDIFKRSLINRWGFDAEILFLAKNLGYSMAEKPVPWADQKGTKVNLLIDSISSLSELIAIRYSPTKQISNQITTL